MYLEFIEKDLKHLDELRGQLAKWEALYRSHVFDGIWPITIRQVLANIKAEIKNTIGIIQENIKNAEDHRRALDEAYHRQSIQDAGDAGEKRTGPGDPDQDAPGPEPQNLGIAS